MLARHHQVAGGAARSQRARADDDRSEFVRPQKRKPSRAAPKDRLWPMIARDNEIANFKRLDRDVAFGRADQNSAGKAGRLRQCSVEEASDFDGLSVRPFDQATMEIGVGFQAEIRRYFDVVPIEEPPSVGQDETGGLVVAVERIRYEVQRDL